MLPVVWLGDAIADLSYIMVYIASENSSAARRLKARLEAMPLPLAEHPYLYPAAESPARGKSSLIRITSSFTVLPETGSRS